MQASNLAPGERLVQCPYNKSHMILNHKQTTHFDKCRKQYEKEERANGRKPEMVACRFNFLHKFLKPELQLHESFCPDQYSVIHTLMSGSETDESKDFKANRPAPFTEESVDDTEDWDAGSNEHAGYDPDVKMKEGCFLYMKPGMTKSERKAAREANRIKWRERANAVAATKTSQSYDWEDNV